MMAQREKKYGKKLLKKIAENGGWSHRIVDTVYGNFKKPFDAIFTRRGVAMEFKFMDGGKKFNLKKWKEEQKNQYISLRKFQDSGAGIGILVIFWKRNNRVQTRWICIEKILEDDYLEFEHMHNEAELLDYTKVNDDRV
jgi:hypothetical protein